MDLSESSEISGKIADPQISKSGNSRLYRITLDQFSNAQSSQKCEKDVKSIQSGIIETGNMIKGLALCDESIADYIRLMFIFDTVKQVSLNDGTLSDTVARKLREHIMIHEIDKYMHLPSLAEHTHEELTVLGITDLPKYEFSYAERLDIRCRVDTLLREKLHEFLSRFEGSNQSAKDVTKINDIKEHQKLFECHDQQLIEQKERIDNLAVKFENDIMKCRHTLNLWRQLKNSDVNGIYYRRAGYLLLQSQVAEVQAKITKLSCLIRMFKETPTTRTAFEKLNMSVNEKLSTVINEVKRKEELKRCYESLRGSEYDKVLKNYFDICKAIRRKRGQLELL